MIVALSVIIILVVLDVGFVYFLKLKDDFGIFPFI